MWQMCNRRLCKLTQWHTSWAHTDEEPKTTFWSANKWGKELYKFKKKRCQGRKIVNSLFHCILPGRFSGEFKIPTLWCSMIVVLKVWVLTSNISMDTNITWEPARDANSWASPQIYWGCILANESDVCQSLRTTVLQSHSRAPAFHSSH